MSLVYASHSFHSTSVATAAVAVAAAAAASSALLRDGRQVDEAWEDAGDGACDLCLLARVQLLVCVRVACDGDEVAHDAVRVLDGAHVQAVLEGRAAPAVVGRSDTRVLAQPDGAREGGDGCRLCRGALQHARVLAEQLALGVARQCGVRLVDVDERVGADADVGEGDGDGELVHRADDRVEPAGALLRHRVLLPEEEDVVLDGLVLLDGRALDECVRERRGDEEREAERQLREHLLVLALDLRDGRLFGQHAAGGELDVFREVIEHTLTLSNRAELQELVRALVEIEQLHVVLVGAQVLLERREKLRVGEHRLQMRLGLQKDAQLCARLDHRRQRRD
eukprot:6180139-Pleurochrysis_carterae.AAC.2